MYTNTARLPQHLVDILTLDEYESRGLGVTTLIDAPRIAVLRRRHEVTQDVMDRYHSFIGTAVHQALARCNPGVVERRICADINGELVCGIPDYYEGETLYDYKTCSTWVNSLGLKESWTRQLNVYRWLLRQHDIVVTKLRLIAFFKDWNKSTIRDGYPNYPIQEYAISCWSLKETSEYIADRVSLHLFAQDLPDDKLPECSSEERWESPGKYAVHLNGKVRAERLLDSEEEARAWIAEAGGRVSKVLDYTGKYMELPKGYTIVVRPTEWKRCGYCDVAPFCNQYAAFATATPDSF
jgi:hypothetical protein